MTQLNFQYIDQTVNKMLVKLCTFISYIIHAISVQKSLIEAKQDPICPCPLFWYELIVQIFFSDCAIELLQQFL